MAQVMLEKYPEIVKATRILKRGPELIGRDNKKFNEEGILYADPSLFDVFDFKLIKGNPKTALTYPRSMVLTESYATKYFGFEDPMGQNLTVEEDTIIYTVTGVVEDSPANSHIKFDMLASISSTEYDKTSRWIGRSVHTYAILNDGVDLAALEEKMLAMFYDYMAPTIEYYTGLSIAEWEGAGNKVRFKLIPITNIHLYSESTGELESTGNVTYIYIYGLIGVIILFIAIFNFVNLATAHSATRAKEVGVRKIIGSTKRSLVLQFMIESIIVSLLATFFAIILVSVFTPSFIDLVGKDLAYGLTTSYLGILAIVGMALLVGLLAGGYPAMVLSAFKPVEVFKGSARSGVKSGWLRSLLVTVQFTASIVIIIGTVVIYNQIDYMLSKNLGFDKEQILVVKRPDWLNKNLDVFKNDLLVNPNITTVSNSETIPGKRYDIRSYRNKDNPETFLFLNNQVSYDHAELLGLELVAGRFFQEDYGLDSNAVVLNEAAVKTFGYEDPIGKPLTSAFKKGRTLTVIGVVKDYNIESLHKSVTPISLELAPETTGYVSIKMSNTRNVRETLEYIEDTWYKYSGNKPLQYFFFNQDYQNLYKSETTTGQVLLVFATLSVFIACLGLIGLITFTASVRKKEIGIRKVLGASVVNLIRLLSNEVVKLIIIATLISWPLAYFASDYWLQNFANRVDVQPWIYLASTIVLVLIVGFAISFQTVKASMGNPVKSLRQE